MPFKPTVTQLAYANQRFPPLLPQTRLTMAELPDTSVKISCTNDQEIGLGVAFAATGTIQGTMRLAGIQTVDTFVVIDFNQQLPLYWMASVLRKGEISPNQMIQPYTGDSDEFDMKFNSSIALEHSDTGWKIPIYDSTKYEIYIGYGMGSSLVCWGYTILCSPNKNIKINAGPYIIFRLDGSEEIGNIVTPSPSDSWDISMACHYLLDFNSQGVGTLSKL